MTVTKIEAVSKTKYQVFMDHKFAFVLYKGELSHYHLEEGGKVEEAVYFDIRQNVVLKRAKLRAMHLLNDMDRTEGQLRDKLKANQYPEDVIEEALQYVKSFGYVNDYNYAKRLIESKKDKKSRREIYAILVNKGLSKDLIASALEESYDSSDGQAAILEFIRKKNYDPEHATDKEKQKFFASLMRKGFSYEDIRSAIRQAVQEI